MRKLLVIILAAFLLNGFSVFGQSRTKKIVAIDLTNVQKESLEQKIARIAAVHRLDPRLFHSLIYAESTYKQNAMSYKGAGCLTQLMPATARRFGLRVDSQVDERFSNIDKCLNAGATYLAWLLNTFRGDVRLALAGYNAGEGAVMQFGWRIPPYRETSQYVEKILALYSGQAGHSIALAYNQNLAQAWASQLYRTWRVRPISQVIPVNPNQTQAQQNQPPSEPEGKKEETPKRVVTRVNIPDAKVRLRTESLLFQ